MVGELRHHHMGEQVGTGAPTRYRQGSSRRLADRIAAATGQLWPDMAHDTETARDILQHLGHILAQLAHGAAAGGTTIGIGRRMHRLVARQVIGQRQALGLAGRWRSIFRWRRFAEDACGMGMFGFEILQRQFQLIRRLRDPLGRLTDFIRRKRDS
jgi:hypothetical protein